MKVSRSIVPSFFTVGNMFCGFYSIIAAFNNRITLAAWMIFAGAFLDAMDGKVARFTKSSSRFGVEYDSFADIITFGLAPSMLIYTIFMQDMKFVGILLSFLPLLFGGIRLARFNIQLKGFDKDYFSGLPIPVAALTLSSFVIFSEFIYGNAEKFPKTMIIIIFVVSILMVSTVRYETMPTLNFKGSTKEKIKVILVILGAILLIIFPQIMLFPFMVIYILSGLVVWILRINTDNSTEKDIEIES
jgi:CDP-diacylglycerol--serine O-phosphatidyltransferase